jgi:D-sedoheptulose 7-phosphate isomerase
MSRDLGDLFDTSAAELRELLARLHPLHEPLRRLGQLMLDCWQAGGKVMLAGNGGSAADAMHFAEELLVRFKKNRRALAAIALCDPAVITCAANDFGYDTIFARQVEGLGRSGDLLILMSTSGNSQNLVEAVKAARALGLRTATFAGRDGGKLRGLCDVELIVPSDITHHIQEVHKVLYHALCAWVDEVID